MLVPARRAVVLIAAGIDEDILAAPPDIEVEHVDLRKPIVQRAAPERGESRFVPAPQHVIARVRKRHRGPRRLSQRRVERTHAEKPRRLFVPWSGIVEPLVPHEHGDGLQRRPNV